MDRYIEMQCPEIDVEHTTNLLLADYAEVGSYRVGDSSTFVVWGDRYSERGE